MHNDSIERTSMSPPQSSQQATKLELHPANDLKLSVERQR
jgi:hypothetical protein